MSKNILLIIDPQNDFSEAKEGIRQAGALAVEGSNDDYRRIINLIKNVKFDEIHVSLDTHTPQHIGHSNFYKDGSVDNYKFKEYNPEKHIPNNVPTPYMHEYNAQHIKARGSNFMIWAEHCIEESIGHQIVQELDNALQTKNNVNYHIKGQNNLSEMYSIFSATVDPDKILAGMNKDEIDKYKYNGKNTDKEYTRGLGCKSYNEAATKVNLNTTRNDDLLKNLFGNISNPNTIYVCGQARTHCVKDSIKDMLKYAEENEINKKNVVLIYNCSSPITDAKDDILKIIEQNDSVALKHTDLIEKMKPNYMKHTAASKGMQKPTTSKGGKRRTRKRSKRKRTQRKQKRSERKRTRRSRR